MATEFISCKKIFLFPSISCGSMHKYVTKDTSMPIDSGSIASYFEGAPPFSCRSNVSKKYKKGVAENCCWQKLQRETHFRHRRVYTNNASTLAFPRKTIVFSSMYKISTNLMGLSESHCSAALLFGP